MAKSKIVNIQQLTSALMDTPWYSVKNGRLVKGAADEKTALYKHEDILKLFHDAKPYMTKEERAAAKAKKKKKVKKDEK